MGGWVHEIVLLIYEHKKAILKNIQPRHKIQIREAIFSVFINLIFSSTIYLLFLQTPLVPKRELFATFLIFSALIWPIFYLVDRFLYPIFQKYTPQGKIILIFISLIFGLFISISTNLPQVYFLYPNHTLTISIPPASGLNVENRQIAITWFSDGWQDVSFSQFDQMGNWRRESNRMVITGPGGGSLHWQGRTNGRSKIEFDSNPQGGLIQVNWDGKAETYDLTGESGKKVIAVQPFTDKNPANFLTGLAVFITSFFLFLIITLFLLNIQIPLKETRSKKPYAWMRYAIPMIVVWGVFFLTFYPGMMTTDSNIEWGQMVSGRFSDSHPVFFSLFLWLVTRIWYSPAAVVTIQIISLSLTVAWGVNILEKQGLPQWGSWSLVSIFTFAPLNGNMVVVVWKDIPYSICLLLFSLMILKIIFSNGEWMRTKSAWVWLGLVSLCLASFRHNGPPIPLISLPLLIIFYRTIWIPIVKAGVIFIFLYLLIQGPLFNLLEVNRSIGFKQQTLIFHIAAHIKTGKPLSPEEIVMAEKILPLNQWEYDCCSVVSTFSGKDFSFNRLSQNVTTIQKLSVELALKEPKIELQHLVCSSAMVWRLPSQCGSTTWVPETKSQWIGTKYGGFFKENSLLLALAPFLSAFLIEIRTNPLLTIFIAPAVYLYLLIYNTIIFVYRTHHFKGLLFMTPACIQTIILALVMVASEFRYQFGVYLVGLFSIGLLFLSFCSPKLIGDPAVSTDPDSSLP